MSKVHIFVRHCNYSSASAHKKRPEWFSREKFFGILLNEVQKNADSSTLTVIFDGDPEDHFIKNYPDIVKVDGGSESKSFTKMLDYVLSRDDIKDEDIVYFCEDDYLHVSGFMNILMEGFETNADYVTLYDHGDKYMPGYYETYAKGFQIQLVPSRTIHWRTTPSTTNTYAMKMGTLKRDKDIHYKYSFHPKVGDITQDHPKFCELWNSGKSLISCIPSYSTHCDFAGIAPVINWGK
jgi:hypothetical protein